MSDNWIKALEEWIKTQHGSAGWEMKLENFISQVEKDAIEKTNKRWESELYRIANEWDDELSELQGLPPHQHNPKMWSIVTNILSRMKSDLLEDKK